MAINKDEEWKARALLLDAELRYWPRRVSLRWDWVLKDKHGQSDGFYPDAHEAIKDLIRYRKDPASVKLYVGWEFSNSNKAC